MIGAPLDTEQLAAMTQGRFRVDGGTFSCAEIDMVMKVVVSGYRKQFVINAMNL